MIKSLTNLNQTYNNITENMLIYTKRTQESRGLKMAFSRGRRSATTEKLSVTRWHVGLVKPRPFNTKSRNKPGWSAGRRDPVKVAVEFSFLK